MCERAAETTNDYERHRILLMYHLFVNLLLKEVKDGLGGAWAFVLRDIIYTLIHQINSRLAHTLLPKMRGGIFGHDTVAGGGAK